MAVKSKKFDDLMRRRVRESIAVKELLLGDCGLQRALAGAARAAARALGRGGKVLIFGNGGSAADAQHLAAELVGRYRRERAALPALALGTNGSALTAISNDYDFSRVFARQVEALAGERDVVIGISTSGNSANVVRGLKAARKRGAVTVGFTGKTGGALSKLSDYCIRVPSDDTARVQEAHILIGHILCEFVEEAVAGERRGAR